MNGVKYYRLVRGISIKMLAEKSDLSEMTIVNMEKLDVPHSIAIKNYKKVRAALGVRVDELFCNDFPEITEKTRAGYSSKTENAGNCITVYRSTEKLTFKALAHRMGVTSRECARQACAAKEPLEKHVLALATYEGMTAEEFRRTYSGDMKAS